MKETFWGFFNFNCTIQELKRCRGYRINQNVTDFNCTIQELKQGMFVTALYPEVIFQLHHTGIKTLCCFGRIRSSILFQLHHTGIKTSRPAASEPCSCAFQLHHTGIKTTLPETE